MLAYVKELSTPLSKHLILSFLSAPPFHIFVSVHCAYYVEYGIYIYMYNGIKLLLIMTVCITTCC